MTEKNTLEQAMMAVKGAKPESTSLIILIKGLRDENTLKRKKARTKMKMQLIRFIVFIVPMVPLPYTTPPSLGMRMNRYTN